MKSVGLLGAVGSLLMALACQFSFGQSTRRPDQIVRYDNTVIQGLISEINETAIYYRKPTAPQGDQYQVKKAEVQYVRYANGDEERFDGKGKAAPARPVAMTRRSQPVAERPAQPRATSPETKTRFGLTAGAGGGYWMAQGVSSDMGLAFRGGLTAEIPLGSRVALAPSVEFLRLSQGKSPNTINLNYGVATLALASLYQDGSPVQLFYSAGLYGAYGLNVSGGGESASFKEAGINSFHAGGEVKLGARFSHAFTLYAQGNYGFTSLAPSGGVSVSQLTFGAGLRYLFGQ